MRLLVKDLLEVSSTNAQQSAIIARYHADAVRFSRYNAGSKGGSNSKSTQCNSVLYLIINVIMIRNGTEIMVIIVVVVVVFVVVIGEGDFLRLLQFE